MGFKETLKKSFDTNKTITLERYKATKFMFITIGFLFFLNFFFVGASFHSDLLILTLPFLYIFFLAIFCFYIYFYVKKSLLEKFGFGLRFYLTFVLVLIFIIFLFPLLYKGGLLLFVENEVLPLIEKIKTIINNL